MVVPRANRLAEPRGLPRRQVNGTNRQDRDLIIEVDEPLHHQILVTERVRKLRSRSSNVLPATQARLHNQRVTDGLRSLGELLRSAGELVRERGQAKLITGLLAQRRTVKRQSARTHGRHHGQLFSDAPSLPASTASSATTTMSNPEASASSPTVDSQPSLE